MKTSIATVSISGDLAEKLAAIAAAGFDGVEIFENDFLAFDGSPRDVGQAGARRRPRDHPVPAVPRFRGPARAAARARLRPRRAQVRRDAGARHRSHAGLLQRLAALARRHRPRRRRFPRTRRAGGAAGLARRLRGARLGPARQRPSRRLGDRAPRRPSQHRPDPRLLPHAGAQDRRRTRSARFPATRSSSSSSPTRR